jgi:hypothetical protein
MPRRSQRNCSNERQQRSIKLNTRKFPSSERTFEQDGRLFLVQDYVEGKTYRELLNERKAQTYIQPDNQNVGQPAPTRNVPELWSLLRSRGKAAA